MNWDESATLVVNCMMRDVRRSTRGCRGSASWSQRVLDRVVDEARARVRA